MNPITDADSPYDSATVADVIIQSSDNVHFFVLGGLLRLVSPSFRDMFDLNHGPAAEQTEKREGLPIIPLSEDSATIQLLLDFLYPHAKKPQPDDVRLYWNAGKAAKKYCIDIIEKKLISRIIKSKLIDQQPLSIYVVATDLEWEDVANNAARKSLKIPLKSIPYVEELLSITGTGFYRFLEYRLRCHGSAYPKEEKLATTPTSVNTDKAFDPQFSPSEAKEDLLCEFDRFRSSPDMDLILRSSDSVEFFVNSTLIRLASPVFNNMFPLKNHRSKDGRPVISVQETGKVLLRLLKVLYHDANELKINDCRTYMGVVLATQKYEMTAIERILRRQVQTSEMIFEDPLRIYLLATKFGWKDVEKMAALNTLSRSLQDMTYVAELDLVTGADLYRLVHFRFKCEDKVCAALRADESISSYWVDNWDKYHQSSSYPSKIPTDWYGNLRARPRGPTMTHIYNQKLRDVQIHEGTFKLPWHALSGIVKCARNAEKIVEDAVSEVTLEIINQSENNRLLPR